MAAFDVSENMNEIFYNILNIFIVEINKKSNLILKKKKMKILSFRQAYDDID